MPQMIIASSLANGFVVFMTPEHDWTGEINAGAVAEDDEQAQALLVAARKGEANCEVVEPYLIPVDVDGQGRRPTRYREFIRAFGPSVRIPA